ncbi:MAG: response regulator transcription factor [Dehalococcoidales bacterium]|nr:response regulator transcription factor [Dehalococcoidales bacterium]
MEKSIRVFLVDDHQVVREGLRRLLGEEENIEVVGQGSGSKEALCQIETLSPDVVLMDIKMPGLNGIELTRQIIQKHLSCKVIMLTLYDEYLSQAMQVGAKGYLLKDVQRGQLVQAIRRVHSGEVVIHEEIASYLQSDHAEGHDGKTKAAYVTMIEEVQLVLPPSVDVGQLMRFIAGTEEILQSPATQIVGSRHEGFMVTIVFREAIGLSNIMETIKNMPEVEAITEEIHPITLKKALTTSKINHKTRITLFVTLARDFAEILSS